jgi:hypothetical protein
MSAAIAGSAALIPVALTPSTNSVVTDTPRTAAGRAAAASARATHDAGCGTCSSAAAARGVPAMASPSW